MGCAAPPTGCSTAISRPEPPEALAGLAALPLFLSLRAAIRAKVEAAAADRLEGGEREEALALARRYFDCAAGFLAYVPPRLVAVGGLSGAGKSALAAALAPRLGRAPGALWLRSDVERKAMFGGRGDRASARRRLRAGGDARRLPANRRQGAARAESRPGGRARRDLLLGRERKAAALVAAEIGVAFDGLFLEAPLEMRLARVASRGADASDADASVARGQRADPLGERGWRALDADGGLTATVARARAAQALTTILTGCLAPSTKNWRDEGWPMWPRESEKSIPRLGSISERHWIL